MGMKKTNGPDALDKLQRETVFGRSKGAEKWNRNCCRR